MTDDDDVDDEPEVEDLFFGDDDEQGLGDFENIDAMNEEDD